MAGPADRPRSTVGPFRVIGKLGAGGMGVVYRAEGPGGVPAAVKVIRADMVDDDLLARFAREARIRIEHPNVVQVLDAGIDADGSPWIAFELIEGEGVAARFARGGVRPDELVDLGVQVCAGLGAAHARGVIHRDLKPGNLIRARDGTLKLLDFGVAHAAGKGTRLTSVGSLLGTPAYLSPEQAQGDVRIDGRTDIWALGALLYEGLAGRTPFERETPLQTIVAVVTEPLVPLATASLRAPPALAKVVERALAKERGQRWPTAQAFAEALAGADLGGAAFVPAPARSGPIPSTRVSAPGAPAAEPPPTRLSAASENRVVALLYAEGVTDRAFVEQAVKELGGVPVAIMGATALGLFGGERWEGDEVIRAAAAALRARRAAAHVAVASGRARRVGAGVSGEALSRAEASCAAGLGGVAIDAESARGLAGRFVLRDAGPRLVEVLAERAASGADAAAGGDLYGREAELAALRGVVARALDEERAQAVLVVGPPGIGKTALRRRMEALLWEPGREVPFLWGRGEPHRRGAALSLFASVFLARARRGHEVEGWPRLDAAVEPEERRRAVARLAADGLPDPAAAQKATEFLGELLEVPMPPSVTLAAARRDPQLMADRLRLVVGDWFAGRAARGPLALVVEDLQWADPASLDALEDLFLHLAEQPFVLFATTRPEALEARPELLGAARPQRIELKGLLGADIERLAASVAGRPLPAPLAKALAERTAGNPLFVHELALALRDRTDLDVAAAAEAPLPLTVQAAVQARLDRLAPAEKELCKRAAVLGRPFTAEELEGLGVAGAERLAAGLARRDVLVARRRSARPELQFRSSLVPEVALRMIPEEQLVQHHRRAAEYLAGVAGTDPEEIARHHDAGGEPARAAERYAEAAHAATAHGDAARLLTCSERALELGAPAAARFALHLARADALRFLGRRDEQGRELEAAARCAASPAERARALTERAVWMRRTGGTAEALAAVEEAVAAAAAAGDPDALARARIWRAALLRDAGRLREAREALARAVPPGAVVAPETRALAAEWRGNVAAAAGDLAERIEASREAEALYRELGDVRRAAGAESNLADAYNRFGAWGDAEAALREALDGLRRVENRVMEGYALANLAYALAMQGRAGEAIAALDAAEALARAQGDRGLEASVGVYRARALERAGRPAEAAALADEAAAEAARLGAPGLELLALTAAARAALAGGDVAAALLRSERALALRDTLGGAEEDEAEVFLVRARALEAAGRAGDAAAVRARGRARLDEVASAIADPAWRARFLRLWTNEP